MRARNKPGSGSVVLDKRSKAWSFYWYEDGQRRSKKVGTLEELPTWAAAWRAAKPARDRLESKAKVVVEEDPVPTVQRVVDEYREEKMPKRIDTRRSYEVWIRNYILPEWGEYQITALQPRPVQRWLDSLAPKLGARSRKHIRAG